MLPSAMDALDDLVIEYEDSLVDLSNLTSSSKRFSDQESGCSNKHASPVTRQERNFSSLYPSREEAEALEVVNASDILAKCRVEDHFKPRKPSPEIVRRSRWGGGQKKSSSLKEALEVVNASDILAKYRVKDHFKPRKPSPEIVRSSRWGGGQKKSSSLKDAVGLEYKSLPPGAHNCMSDPNNSPLEQGGYDCTTPASLRRSSSDVVEVEIAPGFFSPFRGSKETLAAISRGHSINVDCFGCCTSLICIADAEYVLCPVCKVICPTSMADAMLERKLPAKAISSLSSPPLVAGGVGLGLRAIPLL
jgi:hypothetical protein